MSSPPPASVPVALGLGLGGVASSQVGKPPPSPPNHQLQIPSHSFITPPPPSMGSLFTFMQLQELQQQALIYKYMSSGLPVPLHLVLPIWKSLASSAYQHHQVHPAVMMGFKFDVGLLGGFDYKNLLEPEPNRCRRTDGKKWRCARDVVPDHKYCDKHLHRGRNRSRKHVEQQQEAAAAVTAAASAVATRDGASNVATLAAAAGSDATAALPNNDSSVLSVPPPTSLQLMPPASHCPTTINSSVPVYGGGINSLAALRSYATTNTNSNANNVANLFNSASPPQMFGFSPTSVLLGDRTTTGVSYF